MQYYSFCCMTYPWLSMLLSVRLGLRRMMEEDKSLVCQV